MEPHHAAPLMSVWLPPAAIAGEHAHGEQSEQSEAAAGPHSPGVDDHKFEGAQNQLCAGDLELNALPRA